MPLAQLLTDNAYVFASEPVRWIVVGWLFVLGAVLGSFMNVVAHRLPLGLNLSYPGSRCPACGHAIRWHDNLPIVGWLRLGGRCRDCRAPISPRYPIVEALVGAMSALLGWAAIEPVMAPAAQPDALFAFQFLRYAFHMLLLCTLVCAALMEYDGHHAGARMLLAVLAVGTIAGYLWPDLRIAPPVVGDAWGGLIEGAAGMLVALALAALAWPAWVGGATSKEIARSGSAAGALLLVGVFMGPRDTALIGAYAMGWFAVAGLLQLLLARWTRRLWPIFGGVGWAGWLAITTLSRIVARLPGNWPYDEASLLVGAAVCVALWAVLLRMARALAGVGPELATQDR
jgi:leader peptidase (prepilin peptidase)/N-methyltransferase